MLGLAVAAAPSLLALSQASAATPLYWDIDGATAGGSGGTTAAGTWNTTNTNWSTSAAGDVTTTDWLTGAGTVAVFSAGTDVTGSSTITVGEAISVNDGLTFEDGTTTLSGASGSINFGANNFTITSYKNNDNNIAVPLIGSGNITISNRLNGTVTAGNTKVNIVGDLTNFTGSLIIDNGNATNQLNQLQIDSPLANTTNPIIINQYGGMGTSNQTTGMNLNVVNPIQLNGDGWLWGSNGNPSSTSRQVTFSGAISGSSNLWLGIGTGGGQATLNLGAAGTSQWTYTGKTFITENGNGMIRMGADNILPSTTDLVIGSGTANTSNFAPVDLNGHNLQVATLQNSNFTYTSSTGTLTSGNANIYNIGVDAAPAPVTLTMDGGSRTDTVTFSGVIGQTATTVGTSSIGPLNAQLPYYDNVAKVSHVTAGTNISVVKAGSTTEVFTGQNLYTGSTTINGGTLVLGKHFGAIGSPGTPANTVAGDVTVNSNGNLETLPEATLGNTAGYYAGAGGRVTVNGGSVSPGGGSAGSPGVGGLYANGLTLNDGATLKFDLTSSTNYDSILDAGDLTLDAGTHTVSLPNAPAAGTYTLLSYSALDWDGMHGFALPSDPHYSWGFTGNASTAGALTLTVTDPNSHIFVWDIGQGSGATPIADGTGTWVSDPSGTDPNSHNWRDIGPNTNATYDNANNYDVVIGNNVANNGGTITLGGNIRVGGKLTFGPIATPYTINGNGNTLTTSAAGVDADSSATINAPVAFTDDQTWTVASGKTLTLNNTIQATAGNTLTKSGPGTLVVNGSGGTIGAVTIANGTFETNDAAMIGPAIINIGNGSDLKLDVSVDLAGGIAAIDRSTTGQNFTWDFGANNVSISGGVALKGNVTKRGTGDLTLNGDNTSFAGGTGIGILTINDSSTVHLTGFNPLGSAPNWENLGYNNPITLDVPGDKVIGCVKDGNGTVTKIGSGKLTVSGTSSAANGTNPAIDITAGSVQMDSVGGLGGGNQNTAGQMAITLEPGTQLIANFTNNRNSLSINMKDNTTFTLAGTVASQNAVDTEFVGYNTNGTTFSNYGSVLTVTGNATIGSEVQAQITSTTDPNTQVTTQSVASHDLMISMPVHVTSGSTLTLTAANTAGDYGKAAVLLRGVDDVKDHPGDALYVEGGATVDSSTGTGEIHYGSTGRGKPIVGASAGTALLKLGSHSFLRDNGSSSDSTTGTAMTKLVLLNGVNMRLEAPMNATYTTPTLDPNTNSAPLLRTYDGTTGLLGTNATATFNSAPAGYTNIANGYTVLSANRAKALSNTFAPTGQTAQTPDGTLTLAATDAAGATGTVDAGPNAACAVGLALDNTPTSGNLVYQIDPVANGGTFKNFAGLTVQKSNPNGSVTAKLLGFTKIPAVTITGGAKLDVVDKALMVDYPSAGPTPLGGWNGSSYTGLLGLVQSGRHDGDWAGAGITTSVAGGADYTSIGTAEASEALGVGATDTQVWNGQTIDGTTVLVRYTYGGDANLDGVVNIDDYTQIDSSVSVGGALKGWFNGDFNYDGNVDIDDYTIIDSNIGIQGAPFPTGAGIAGSSAALSGVTAVPEPASLGLVVLAAGALIGRRRRRGNV